MMNSKYMSVISSISTLLILHLACVSSQRISEKKCQEYTNLYRRETTDFIFMTTKHSELECPKFRISEQVVGGRKAHPNEFPSMASLLLRDRDGELFTYCGGTLISDEYVLTAAHCLNKNRPQKISFGEINLAPSQFSVRRRDVNISSIIIHPDYKPPSSYNDIALIKLDKKLPLGYGLRPAFRPACLVQSEIPRGTTAMAAGWGRTVAFGDVSSHLLVVDIPVTERDTCGDFYRDTLDFNQRFPGVADRDNWQIPETNICAGKVGKDTCQGDSGGPLYVTGNPQYSCFNYIAGITSFGSNHCGSETPGVYTKVFAYLDWIEGHVWPNNS